MEVKRDHSQPGQYAMRQGRIVHVKDVERGKHDGVGRSGLEDDREGLRLGLVHR